MSEHNTMTMIIYGSSNIYKEIIMMRISDEYAAQVRRQEKISYGSIVMLLFQPAWEQ